MQAGWFVRGDIDGFFGLIHAYELTPAGVQNKFDAGTANDFALAYLGAPLLLVALHCYNRRRKDGFTGPVA